MGRKRITVTNETDTGRNPKYHIRNINGIDTPISNPDKNTNNNLG